MHLHWGDQQAGDVNVVGIFILKVWQQDNTVQKLKLCLSTKHQWCKPNSTSPSPDVILHSVGSEHGSLVKCNSLIRDVMVETGLSKDVSVFLLLSPIYLGFVDRSPLLYHLLKSQLCEILIMTKHLQYYWHSHQPQLYSCWLGCMFRCCCIDAQYIMSQHCIWSYTQISEEL